jgi:hypothetical protein
MVALNNSLRNEDVQEVNTSALLENVRRHGQGNNYKSPNLTNPRLNDLPTRQRTPTRKASTHKTPSTPRKKPTLRRRGRHTNNTPSPSTPKRKPNTNNPIAPPAPKKSKKSKV